MKQEEVDFTIVIPTYNVESYVEKTIESCVNQNYTNMEILIVDDGSTDKTQDFIKKYKDSRIKVIFQKNSGVSVARNNGIENAKGKWILFLDGDDWLEENSLNKIKERINTIEENTDIIIFDYFVDYKNYTLKESFFNDVQVGKINYSKKDLVEACIIRNEVLNKNGHVNLGVPWARVYKKEYLKQSNILFKVGLKRMQDMVFNLYAIYNSSNIYYFNDAIYHYRMNNLSATKKYSNDFDQTAILISNCIEEFMNKYNLEKELKNTYNLKVFFLYLEIIRLQYIPKENKKSIITKLKELNKLLKEKPFNCIKYVLGLELGAKRKVILKLLQLNIIYPVYLYYCVKVFWEKKKYFKANNN